jgi:hypothetical protein
VSGAFGDNWVMDSWIDRYVGEWKDAAGNCLSIRKITDETACVTFLAAPRRAPIARPWCHGRLSVDMPARYYRADGPELIVELWEEGKGFTLELCYEADYALRDGSIEALTVGLGRHEGDTFLDQYYRLLGPLQHFTRAESAAAGRRAP